MPEFVEPRARELFAGALERTASDRVAFLARQCGADTTLRHQVEQLLLAHEAASGRLVESRDQLAERPGDRIGHYKLLQKIGEGGFGVVWMAEQQEPVRRRVALKVLKAGMDTGQVVGRFEAERQALAMMDHPNIAKVFDGGSTPSGRPYFVMELVKGVPITQFCDDAGLGMKERLSLFVPVCQAVQHAHQKGVIHRDLKPSNVLVTLHDGAPLAKVIDFGIAKATSGSLTDRTVFTEFRQMLGTPEYMAPEQAELSSLDVDTRADIYSLGVLLYELLTGTRPFELKSLLQAGYAEMLRTIKEVDPPKPSTRVSTLGEQVTAICKHRQVTPKALGTLMRGDLDWIVMKALEKERSRRYDTATALAEDVLRHLRHEPVLASPPSRLYRWRKYTQRHRVGFAAGIAVAASLLAGAVVATLGWLEAEAQATAARGAETRAQAALVAEQAQKEAAVAATAQAQREAAKARTVTDVVLSMFHSSDPSENKGRDYPVRLLLDEWNSRLAGMVAREPEVEAPLRFLIGNSYLGLGLAAKAEPHVLRALELFRADPAADSLNLQQCRLTQVWLLRQQGRIADAIACLDDPAAGPVVGPEPEATWLRVRFGQARAFTLDMVGRYDEAEAAASSALEEARSRLGVRDALVVDPLRALAAILESRGQYVRAVELAREALGIAVTAHGPLHVDVAQCLNSLACALDRAGQLAEAEQRMREAVAMYEALLSREHYYVLGSKSVLAVILQHQGDLHGAEPLAREAVTLGRRVLGDAHPTLAACLGNLANIVQDQQRLDEAEELYREALAIRQRAWPEVSVEVARGLNDLAVLLGRKGQHTEAAKLLGQALAIARQTVGDAIPVTAQMVSNVVRELVETGHPAEAEQMLGDALARQRETLGEHHPVVGASLHDLAHLLRDRGDAAGAEAAFEQAATCLQAACGDTDDVVCCLGCLGELLGKRGEFARGEAYARRALDICTRKPHPDAARIAESMNMLANLLAQRGAHDEAERMYRDALDRCGPSLGEQHAKVLLLRNSLGVLLEARGRLEEAEAQFRRILELESGLSGYRAVERSSTVYGARDLVMSRMNLGWVLSRQGKDEEAEVMLREALQGFTELGIAAADDLAVARGELCRVLMRRQRFDDAEPLLRQQLENLRRAGGGTLEEAATLDSLARIRGAHRDRVAATELRRQELAIRQRVQGEACVDVILTVFDLEQLASERGDHSEADTLVRQASAAIDVLGEVGGADLQGVVRCRNRLAWALRRRGDLAGAERIYRELVATAERVPDLDAGLTASNQSGLAACLLANARWAEAEPLARACLATRTARGESAERIATAKVLLGRALAGLGRDAEAEPFLADGCTTLEGDAAILTLRDGLPCLIALLERTGRGDQAAPWRDKLKGLPPGEGKR